MVLASLIFFEPQKGLALSYQCGIVRLLVVNRLLPKNMGPPFDLTYQSVPRGSGSRGRAGREEGTAGEGGAVFRRVSTFGTRISDEPPTPFRMVPTGGAELTHLNAVSHSGPRRARKTPSSPDRRARGSGRRAIEPDLGQVESHEEGEEFW